MNLEMSNGVSLICYADGLAVSVVAKTKTDLITNTETSLHSINTWMQENKLAIAPQKTVAIMLSGNRRAKDITFELEESKIPLSKEATYLGVRLDPELNFGRHVKHVCEKAQRVSKAFCAILPNIKGPKEKKDPGNGSAIHNLYAAPVWIGAMKFTYYKNMVLSSQRVLALRTCCAYRTTSTDAALVIAGMVPINLLAEERGRLYRASRPIDDETKNIERERTLETWQLTWDSSTRGRWTNRLIKNIKNWIERPHGEVSFHMTQFLTGHGVFYSYLKKIKKTRSEECIYCREDTDDAEHTFFKYSKWKKEREELERNMGQSLSPDSIVPAMVAVVEGWTLVEEFVEKILKEKEQDENQERSAP
jgi:hypothetical protein